MSAVEAMSFDVIDRQMVLSILNSYEAMAVEANDPEFAFAVLELKERLGLPLEGVK